jgi:hypothetical protein
MLPSPRRSVVVGGRTARFCWQFIANTALLIVFHQFILTTPH